MKKQLTVLVDAIEPDQAIARSAADAPEIDGLVYIENSKDLTPGEFVTVRITDSDTHDLYGEMI